MSPHPPSLFSALHIAGDFPFSDAVRFTFGGPIHNLWPLLVMPAAAAFAADRAAARLPKSTAAAPAALALAAAPGLLAVLLIANSWLAWQPFQTWRGVLLYRITPAVALALVLWAVARFAVRQWQVARLFRLARAPSARLAAVAHGLRVRELPSAAPDCFVAGLFRPTVFVSSGALARLDDAELAAALAHERAHVAGGDPLMLALLAVLGDLAPFGRGRAAQGFLAACEARADRAAVRHAGALSLASALVALARPAARPATVLPMAALESLAWRMEALLREAPRRPPAISAGVWAPVAFLAWPVAQRALLSMFCG